MADASLKKEIEANKISQNSKTKTMSKKKTMTMSKTKTNTKIQVDRRSIKHHQIKILKTRSLLPPPSLKLRLNSKK